MGPAVLAGKSAVSGSLQPGKWADFIVLEQDIFALPAAEIGATDGDDDVRGWETGLCCLTYDFAIAFRSQRQAQGGLAVIVGMDFGTTNSGMAVYDGRTVAGAAS